MRGLSAEFKVIYCYIINIVERDSETKFYVGYVPSFPEAHSQGETLDELQENLREVIEMLLEDSVVMPVMNLSFERSH